MLPTAHRPCMHVRIGDSKFVQLLHICMWDYLSLHADNQADLHRISAVRKHISIASSLI